MSEQSPQSSESELQGATQDSNEVASFPKSPEQESAELRAQYDALIESSDSPLEVAILVIESVSNKPDALDYITEEEQAVLRDLTDMLNERLARDSDQLTAEQPEQTIHLTGNEGKSAITSNVWDRFGDADLTDISDGIIKNIEHNEKTLNPTYFTALALEAAIDVLEAIDIDSLVDSREAA